MSIETNEFRTDENPDSEQDETSETSEQRELSDLPGQQPEQTWPGDEAGTVRTAEPGELDETDETDGLDESDALHGLGESNELDEYPAFTGLAQDADVPSGDEERLEPDLTPSTGPDIAETEDAQWQETGDADRLQNAEQLETADQPQNPDQPEAGELEGVAKPENLGGRGVGDSGQPLVGLDARDEFLSRWEQIQVSFVEDPATAVESAEVLTQEIGAAMLAAFEDRVSEFATAGRVAADTEQRRLALRQYRAFIGVILP